MDFILGELFCGPGGMALGAGLAGQSKTPIIDTKGEKYTIHHLWGVDKDEDAIETYRQNVAKKFGGDGIATDALKFVSEMTDEQKKITALAFGFPCNDFSLVGDQTGLGGKFGSLYQAGIAVINQTNPLWFIAENVSGIHSADGGKALIKILTDLKNAGKGYTITANLYKFEEYGVPQYRHRFIIVGIRNDQKLKFKVPAPTTPDPAQQMNVEDALKDIPNNVSNMELPRMNKRVVQRLKLTPPWKNAWFLEDLQKMTPKERRNVLRKVTWYKEEFSDKSDTEIKKLIEDSMLHCVRAKMSHIYKRLQADRPSYTITGSGGGGTHVYHWCEHRSLTNRERARIQTFPDDFIFYGSSEKVRKQIGMAVPTMGAKIIFEHILKTFAGIPYDAVDTEFKFDNYSTVAQNALETAKIPENSVFKDRLANLSLTNLAFQYLAEKSIYVSRKNKGNILFSYDSNNYTVELKAFRAALNLFREQGFISERTLQLNCSEYFAEAIKAFFVIAMLDKLGMGKMEEPYAKTSMKVLLPIITKKRK